MNEKIFISATGKGLSRAIQTDADVWVVETLLKGEQINCFATDPHQPDIVYAGTQGNGLLRSNDKGKTWRSHSLDGQVVKSIALCKSEPNLILVGTKPPAIFASHDTGQTWTELEAFRQMRSRYWYTPAEPGEPYIQGLAVSPTDPNNIIAGVEYGALLRSSDGGRTWQGHLSGASRDCHSLMFHATDGDWVYQGGGGPPVSVSRDGGRTWKASRKGMGMSYYGWSVAADPVNPEIRYISAAPFSVFPKFYLFPRMHWEGHSNSFIFRAKGDGRWERLNGGLPQPLDYAVYALLTDPNATGHLYAGLSNGDVWHTVDYGDKWTQLPFNLTAINRSLIML